MIHDRAFFCFQLFSNRVLATVVGGAILWIAYFSTGGEGCRRWRSVLEDVRDQPNGISDVKNSVTIGVLGIITRACWTVVEDFLKRPYHVGYVNDAVCVGISANIVEICLRIQRQYPVRREGGDTGVIGCHDIEDWSDFQFVSRPKVQ